ncbi:MAG: hypothetical protein U0V74_12665 [Chitinophagales bacterium]
MKLFVLLTFILLLSGCIKPEDKCNYLKLTSGILQDGVWHVDSFQIHVYDSATAYLLDTIYVNDGTINFNKPDNDNCQYHGKATFQRKGGATIPLDIRITDVTPEQFDCCIYCSELKCDDYLDGLPRSYSTSSAITISNSKIVISEMPNHDYFCGAQYQFSGPKQRLWRFVLSKL